MGLNNVKLEDATKIIDLFLLEGSRLLNTLFVSCAKHKHKYILNLANIEQIRKFVNREMVFECVNEVGLSDLVDI